MPRLHDYGGDLSKDWFIFYSYRNPHTGKMVRFREYKGLSKTFSRRERSQKAKELIDVTTLKLKNGWNPFEGEQQIVYSDNLEYQQAAKVFGKLKSGVKSIRYYCSRYLDFKRNGIRPSTYTTYKSKFRYLEAFINKSKIGSHPAAFTEEHARRFSDYLVNIRKVGKKSINQYNTLMRSLWDFMIDEQAVKINVFKDIRRLKAGTNKPRIYSQKLITELKSTMQELDPQMLIAIKFIFNCLIRPGELRFLQLKHIDFERGLITVPAEIAKTNKLRIVDIPDYIIEDLKIKRYDQYHGNMYIIGVNGAPSKKPVSRGFLYSRFCKIKTMAGVPKEFWLYAWKHTGMVEMKLAGVDWLDIKNQAGHQSLDQTIEYTTELMGVSSMKIKKEGPRI